MASSSPTAPSEKDVLSLNSDGSFATPKPQRSLFPTFSPLSSAYDTYTQWRISLGLPYPGPVENLQKEVRSTHLTNFAFDGGRADLVKTLSVTPTFQVTHGFAVGSQASPSAYNFGVVYATPNTLLTGGVDHDGNVNARSQQQWNNTHTSKIQAQFSASASQNMTQIEHEYTGLDYALNAKAINPWPTDLTGIYIGSYLQSVTKNLALGVEALYQRPSPDLSEMTQSFLAKYTGTKKDWIATAQFQPAGILQTTYWQKLSEKVDVAADLQVMVSPTRRDGVATLGAKYDLRLASFRAQVDSTGKVSAYLEQRFAPTLMFQISGEIDHAQNAAKFGIGVMIDSASTDLSPEELGMSPR